MQTRVEHLCISAIEAVGWAQEPAQVLGFWSDRNRDKMPKHFLSGCISSVINSIFSEFSARWKFFIACHFLLNSIFLTKFHRDVPRDVPRGVPRNVPRDVP